MSKKVQINTAISFEVEHGVDFIGKLLDHLRFDSDVVEIKYKPKTKKKAIESVTFYDLEKDYHKGTWYRSRVDKHFDDEATTKYWEKRLHVLDLLAKAHCDEDLRFVNVPVNVTMFASGNTFTYDTSAAWDSLLTKLDGTEHAKLADELSKNKNALFKSIL